MRSSRPPLSIKIPGITLLAVGGGLLGFWAGKLISGALEESGHDSAKAEQRKSRNNQSGVSKADQRCAMWKARCTELSAQSIDAWAAGLAAAPRWMWWHPIYREELERFVAFSGAEGIEKGIKAGICGELLSMAAAKQNQASIPSMIAAFFVNPELLSRQDVQQIAFDATKAGEATAVALEPVVKHLVKFYSADQSMLDQIGFTLGKLNLDYAKFVAQNLSTEESREAVVAAAISARALSQAPGPDLTTDIENLVVGAPALKAAFEKAGFANGNGDRGRDAEAALGWARTLEGYKQEAVLKGWIAGRQEEQPVTTPLEQLLADPESMRDPIFIAKTLELIAPSILAAGLPAVSKASSILKAYPGMQAILSSTSNPSLKELLTPPM